MRPENALDKRRFTVRPVADKTDALPLIVANHYSRGIGNIRRAIFVHGMYRRDDDDLVGAAVWSNGLPKSVCVFFYPDEWTAVLHLTRLVVAPDLPTNAASYLLGASVRLVKASGRWRCLATYADTSQGHTGTIYRATNWEPFGMAAPYAIWHDADGRLVSDRDQTGRGMSTAEMTARGYHRAGKSAKHRFRMVIG